MNEREEGWINEWISVTMNKPSEQFHAKGNIEQDTKEISRGGGGCGRGHRFN